MWQKEKQHHTTPCEFDLKKLIVFKHDQVNSVIIHHLYTLCQYEYDLKIISYGMPHAQYVTRIP
jgi:hypothetical protein